MSEVNLTQNLEKNKDFLRHLEEESGQKPGQCFQCMKCTGGCPFQFTMDYPPSMIMRMLQDGMVDEVLNSYSIWTCATCATCTTRCPRDIDIARLMDTLRVIAYQKGLHKKAKNMYVFHSTFMKSVGSHGRLYEVGLALGLNLGTGDLLKDAEFGLPLFMKGKLSPFPHNIKGKDEIKKLYAYARKIGE